jgi:hypothetical protein
MESGTRTVTMAVEDSTDWWPYAPEFPNWHVWRGVAGVLYARRLLSSPPRVVRSMNAEDLRERIRQAYTRR